MRPQYAMMEYNTRSCLFTWSYFLRIQTQANKNVKIHIFQARKSRKHTYGYRFIPDQVNPANTKHLYNVGPTLHRWYTNVLCLLGMYYNLDLGESYNRNLGGVTRQTQDICINCIHRRPNVIKLVQHCIKCYTTLLCLLRIQCENHIFCQLVCWEGIRGVIDVFPMWFGMKSVAAYLKSTKLLYFGLLQQHRS